MTAEPLRILVVVNLFHPDRAGGGAIFSDFCTEMAARGHDVTVRCAYPYFPEWRDKSGGNGFSVWRYNWRGVNVERYGLYIPSAGYGLGRRLLYEFTFFCSLLRSLPRSSGFDVVVAFSTLLSAVGFAALVRSCFGHPLWINVQDLSADAAAATGIARIPGTARLLAEIESLIMRRGDQMSAIAPVMAERVERICRPADPVLHLPNWLNESLAVHIEDAVSPRPSGPTVTPRLLYAGNVGKKQDLLEFCTQLQATTAEFSFDLHCSGTGAKDIQRWCDSVSDPRFRIGSFMTEKEFVDALLKTDLFVITETRGTGGSYMPSKLIPAISVGTPVMAVSDDDSALGMEMIQHGLGPLFSWDEIDRVSIVLRQLATGQAPIAEWRDSCLKRSAFYDRQRIIDCFETELGRLAKKRRPRRWDGCRFIRESRHISR